MNLTSCALINSDNRSSPTVLKTDFYTCLYKVCMDV